MPRTEESVFYTHFHASAAAGILYEGVKWSGLNWIIVFERISLAKFVGAMQGEN